MNFLDLEPHAQPEMAQAELDRFGHQAVSIVALALTLSGVSCAILMYVML
ncbi:hypothetical protein HPT29_028465 (plasmid) [Microvirga terrae]|uniref:Uncharacterized protein n=1 Tax=Microvirga terrae TaxID=2740529 RepID=A0ABY5S4D0_9HYPH|nr:hypothetical protein [Microvirga terrae]UVF22837.1 hypothetical protein HPT29_028465 [Microvirga terrae]